MRTNDGPPHPLKRVDLALRIWLVYFVVHMMFTAAAAGGFVLSGWLRPVPYLVLAGVGVVWLMFIDRGRVVIGASAVITVGVGLRAVEVAMFATEYPMRVRLTGGSVWLFVAATAFVMGFLNIFVATRKYADSVTGVGSYGDH